MFKSERSLIKSTRNNNSKNHLNACNQLNYQDFFTHLFLHSHEHDFLKATVLRETHCYSSHHKSSSLHCSSLRTPFMYSLLSGKHHRKRLLTSTPLTSQAPDHSHVFPYSLAQDQAEEHWRSSTSILQSLDLFLGSTAGPHILQSTGNKHMEGLRMRWMLTKRREAAPGKTW